jgi:hypothetical protein
LPDDDIPRLSPDIPSNSHIDREIELRASRDRRNPSDRTTIDPSQPLGGIRRKGKELEGVQEKVKRPEAPSKQDHPVAPSRHSSPLRPSQPRRPSPLAPSIGDLVDIWDEIPDHGWDNTPPEQPNSGNAPRTTARVDKDCSKTPPSHARTTCSSPNPGSRSVAMDSPIIY